MNLTDLNITGYLFTVFAVIALYFVMNKQIQDLNNSLNDTHNQINLMLKEQNSLSNPQLRPTVHPNMGADDDLGNEDLNDDDLGNEDLNDDDLGNEDLNDDDIGDDDLSDEDLGDDDLSDDDLGNDDLGGDGLDVIEDLGGDNLNDDLGDDNLNVDDLGDDGLDVSEDLGADGDLSVDGDLSKASDVQPFPTSSIKAVNLETIEEIDEEASSSLIDNLTSETLKSTNYKKMKVPMLRSIVSKFELSDAPSKHKKNELIELIDNLVN